MPSRRKDDDPTIPITDLRGSLVQRYGFKGIILAVLITCIPYLLTQWDEYKQAQVNDSMKLEIKESRDNLKAWVKAELKDNLRIAIEAHGKSKLNKEQAIYLMKTAVGYQSIHKVEWIVDYLKNNDVFKNQDRAKQAIKSELIRQSNIYIKELNKFVNSDLQMLGNWVANNFPMDEFLEAVYAIVLDPLCDDPKNKGTDIMYLMLDMQNDLWEKAK